MPLLDHFRPPIDDRLPWPSLLHGWAVRVADQLCERLPTGFLAAEQIRLADRPPFDVASYSRETDAHNLKPEELAGWSPPAADGTIPFAFADQFEVHVREMHDPLRRSRLWRS